MVKLNEIDEAKMHKLISALSEANVAETIPAVLATYLSKIHTLDPVPADMTARVAQMFGLAPM